jgi:hypothetical protein
MRILCSCPHQSPTRIVHPSVNSKWQQSQANFIPILSLPLNLPKPPSPSFNMAAQQNPTPSVHHALLQIIVPDSSMTSSIEKYTTAVIPVSVDMDPQDLEIQLNLLFQDDLFGVKKQIPNREVHFAIWSIRWNDVWVLPDMVMIKRLDFGRGLALMQARGWRDTLVVRCELKRKG